MRRIPVLADVVSRAGLLHARYLVRRGVLGIEHGAELDVEDVRPQERERQVLEHD